MPTELLLDTGAFAALVDRSEEKHADCVAVLERWTGPVLTPEAVLTETLHLVGPAWRPQEVCLEFFLRGAVLLAPPSRTSLQRVTDLIAKCHDLPMDCADATLVALAEETESDWVFTLDQKGFSTYRLHSKNPSGLPCKAILELEEREMSRYRTEALAAAKHRSPCQGHA